MLSFYIYFIEFEVDLSLNIIYYRLLAISKLSLFRWIMSKNNQEFL